MSEKSVRGRSHKIEYGMKKRSLSCPAVEPVKASVRRRFSQMSAVRARWRIAEQGPAD